MEGYAVRSNMVMIRFIEGKQRAGMSLIVDKSKNLAINDIPKYWDEHPFIGEVMLVGRGIDYLAVGDFVLLRGLPANNEFVLIDGQIYYVLQESMILAIKKTV